MGLERKIINWQILCSSIPALKEGKIEIPPLKKLKVRKNPETAAYQNQTISDDDLPF